MDKSIYSFKFDVEDLGKFAKNLIKNNRFEIANMDRLEGILKVFDKLNLEQQNKFLSKLNGGLKKDFKSRYYTFLKTINKHHKVDAFRLADVKPKLRQALDNQIKNSLALIKNNNDEYRKKLENRFRNWATLPTKETRTGDWWANLFTDKEMEDTHTQFVIKDQTRKLNGNFDKVVSEELGAVGFIWRNRQDKKVVGNPTGLYPKGNDTHGDHWDREGRFYILSGSKSFQKGLIKKTKYVMLDVDIHDGMPSIPYGCRCYAEYVYKLKDIPKKYAGCITEKGQKYV